MMRGMVGDKGMRGIIGGGAGTGQYGDEISYFVIYFYIRRI